MSVWVVIDVGCLECGIHSEPIGIFRTEREALAAAQSREQGSQRGTERSAQVFEMTPPESCA